MSRCHDGNQRWCYEKWTPCLFSSILFAYTTKFLHESSVAFIISNATVFYAISYQFLRTTGLFQPRKLVLKKSDEAEWRSRIIGMINAVVLVWGSALCFMEWPRIPPGEGFIQTVKVWVHPITFASMFVGYLQWDFCWLLYHYKENNDIGTLIHHTLFIMISHYVLSSTTMARPFAWLSFTELSTPFLHIRWFFAVLGQKTNPWYQRSSIIFALTFLFTRVICYTLGLVDLWQNKHVWGSGPWGLHAVVLGLHAGWLLNLFWGSKIVSGMVKMMKPKCSKTLDTKSN